MSLPPLNTLRAFQLTARLSSVSRAGEELHITHAAVSNQIKRLETWFGQKLFERVGRGVMLTPAGQEFQKTVDAALATIAASAHSLKQTADKKSIRVACLPSIASRWLIPSLSDFHGKYPDIAIRLIYSKAFENFDPDRSDVLITHLENRAASNFCVKLFARNNRPVAGRLYLSKRRHFLDGSLEGARFLHDETTQSWEDWFEKAGYRPGKFTNGPIFDDFNMLSTAVLAGQGVALCPVEVFRREIAEGKLITLSPVATLEDHGYYLIAQDKRSHSIQAFKKWFTNICAAIA